MVELREENPTEEIIEEATSPPRATPTTDESEPLLDSKPKAQRTVRTKVPEVEIRLFRCGKGPIEVFKSSLGGWDQDQLEVRDILDKYGFKSIYAFNAQSGGRGAPIRFNPKNGRSILPYRDGAVISIDGEPKDSLLKPVTKILIGVTFITFLILVVTKETPGWGKKLNFSFGSFNIPPWILALVVVVFTRLRKRTRDFLTKRSWRLMKN